MLFNSEVCDYYGSWGLCNGIGALLAKLAWEAEIAIVWRLFWRIWGFPLIVVGKFELQCTSVMIMWPDSSVLRFSRPRRMSLLVVGIIILAHCSSWRGVSWCWERPLLASPLRSESLPADAQQGLLQGDVTGEWIGCCRPCDLVQPCIPFWVVETGRPGVLDKLDKRPDISIATQDNPVVNDSADLDPGFLSFLDREDHS